MIGLMFLGFFTVYFLVSFLVIKGTVIWARKRGRSGWCWGLLTAFLMYNLVFWDWIPSVALQSYYCRTEAGFWVYKDPKKWLSENPNAPNELTYSRISKSTEIEEDTRAYHLNERIDWIAEKNVFWPKIRRYEMRIIDNKNNEVLAKEIYFECGACGGPLTIWDYRFWMNQCECAIEKRGRQGGLTAAIKSYGSVGREISDAN